MHSLVPDTFCLNSSSLYLKKSTNTIYSASVNKRWKLNDSSLVLKPSQHDTELFIHKTSTNLLIQAKDCGLILINDLATNKLVKQIQTSNLSLNSIQASDSCIVFSSLNEIKIFNLNSLSLSSTLSIHANKIKKLVLSNSGKILSLSNKLIYSDIHSDETFKFDDFEVYEFLNTENFKYVISLTEKKTKIWDLQSQNVIMQLGSAISDQVYLTLDNKYFIFSHFQANFNNWNRPKKVNATIDVLNTKKMQVELGILYKRESKFIVWKEKIIYVNSDSLFQNWKIREVPVISEDLVMTSCYQEGKYIYIGSDEGLLYLFDGESGEELKRAEIHEGYIFSIALKDEFIVTGSVDETIKISQKDDFKVIVTIFITGLSDFCCLDTEIVSVSLYGNLDYWKFPTNELVSSVCNSNIMYTGVKFIYPYLIISCKNGGIYFSTPHSLVEIWPAQREIICTTLSINNLYIVAGCKNGKIIYWSKSQTLSSLSNESDFPLFNEIAGNACQIDSVSINSASTHIMYISGDTCRIWSIKLLRHIFSFDCKFSSFFNTGHKLSCIFTNGKSTKTLKILKSDTKVLSKKSILLLLFKRRYKIL